ncbi:MAG: RNase adaptor protein RapZ, partial [Clostridia bacterium]|nr:RNase adaptor protein RapZ [Clostridia bacterium]
MEFLIITGMSGAGKSQAANTLEDIGWYCIDNMPAQLIPKFAELYTAVPDKQERVAFIIDIRGEIEFVTLFSELDALREQGADCRTVFLDCDDDVIITRYKFTRRTHPFVTSKNITIAEALRHEREILEVAMQRADYTIDTTNLSPKQLKDKMLGIANTERSNGL